jgi:energy-coupling factor transport system permease protein
VIVARDLAPAQLDSVLGRTSPVLKLAIALVWLVGLATTNAWLPPIVLAVAAVVAALTVGRVPWGTLGSAVAPLWLVALGIGLFNTLFGAANADPTSATIIVFGPWRITQEALQAGVGLALRVVAIGATGAVFALTTDSTRLVDALVQQARVPERFAYGALAAYGAIPRFGSDLANLRAARRMRGLSGSWHPRILVGLLVLAIRHGDRMALAMDARAFGSGPRSRYREVPWTWLDLVAAVTASLVFAIALATAR